jgi:hypothetical protein
LSHAENPACALLACHCRASPAVGCRRLRQLLLLSLDEREALGQEGLPDQLGGTPWCLFCRSSLPAWNCDGTLVAVLMGAWSPVPTARHPAVRRRASHRHRHYRRPAIPPPARRGRGPLRPAVGPGRGTPATQLLTARTKGPARADTRRHGRPTARGPRGRNGPDCRTRPGRSGPRGPRHRHQRRRHSRLPHQPPDRAAALGAQARGHVRQELSALGTQPHRRSPAESRTCLTVSPPPETPLLDRAHDGDRHCLLSGAVAGIHEAAAVFAEPLDAGVPARRAPEALSPTR